MNKVLVLRGDSYKAVGELFVERGMSVIYDTSKLSEVDLVVFTGGSDVSPWVYGEEPNGARGCDEARDHLEVSIYNEAQTLGIPCVGICRGGQLLNVLNGGSMIQDIKPMLSGDVLMGFLEGPEEFKVRVDQHQGMITGDKGETLGVYDLCNGGHYYSYEIFYPETKDLCVQYHPEWGHEGTKQRFFELMERFYGMV